MTKKTEEVSIRMPTGSMEGYKEIAKAAGVSTQTVLKVILAIQAKLWKDLGDDG